VFPKLQNDLPLEYLFYSNGKSCSLSADLVREKNVILCFHGFGANAWDLSSLGSSLQGPILFFQGPLPVYGPDSRAWFLLSHHLLTTIQEKTPETLALEPISWSESLRQNLTQCVEQLKSLGAQSLDLMGFSQGGMLAMHLYPQLASILPVKGLHLFSSALIGEKALGQQLSKAPSIPELFMTHGKQDTVLPFACALYMEKVLREYSRNTKLKTFSGGHTIDRQIFLDWCENR
jgi:phospholipase/carboxylesterase